VYPHPIIELLHAYAQNLTCMYTSPHAWNPSLDSFPLKPRV
jgi:hypothetical protein